MICALIGIPAASFTMLAVVLARRLNADMLSFFIFAMLLPAAGATVFFLFAGANPRIAVFFVFSEAIIAVSYGIGTTIGQRSTEIKRQFWIHYALTVLSLPFIAGTFYGYAYLVEISSRKYQHIYLQKSANNPLVSPYWEAAKNDAKKWFSFKSFDGLFTETDKCILERKSGKRCKLTVANGRGWSCVYYFEPGESGKIIGGSVIYLHKGIFERGKGELICAKFSPDRNGSFAVEATVTPFDGKGWEKKNIDGLRRAISGAEALNAVESHERNRTEDILMRLN